MDRFLSDIRDTWSEYESMLGKPPTQISKGILAQLDKYRPYEQKLVSPIDDKAAPI